MKRSLERAWVSLTNSDRYHRFTKQGLGSKFLGAIQYRKLIVAKNYVTTYPKSRMSNGAYQNLAVFCSFLGPTKSGSTLLGSLLDAHPEAVVADEVDALHYVEVGFNRHQIFEILLRRSRRHAMVGRVTARRLTPYNFEIEGQWQGRYQKLRVIGDSKAGISTRRLGENPRLLERLEHVMKGVEPRFIMVLRNPFDPITAMRIRGQRSVEDATSRYFENCDYLVSLLRIIDPNRLQIVRYEEFVEHPESILRRLCAFLGLSLGQEYLEACTSIIYDEPERLRETLEWSPADREAVARKSAKYDFLAGYSFEE
jgi:hypothetical protein